jgi:acetyl-CoA acyltransferase 2
MTKIFFIGIFIVAAKRTPFGTYGGKFVQKSAADLQEVAAKAALASAGAKAENIDHVIIGNVLGVSTLIRIDFCSVSSFRG